MSHSAENDVRHEWGVVGPGGRMWTYESEAVARLVAHERGKDLHHRTVTRSPWTRVLPPGAETYQSDTEEHIPPTPDHYSNDSKGR